MKKIKINVYYSNICILLVSIEVFGDDVDVIEKKIDVMLEEFSINVGILVKLMVKNVDIEVGE